MSYRPSGADAISGIFWRPRLSGLDVILTLAAMRKLPIAAVFMLVAMLAGCEPPPSSPRLAGAGMDMFTPTKMRIHPLSRIAYPTAETEPATQPSTGNAAKPMLEARIELSDQFGDPGKGAGTLTLELFDEGASILGKKSVGVWNFSVDTPESNREHWDRTTRTYLFKIPLGAKFPNAATGQRRYELRATFTLPNNKSLSDTLELTGK